VNHQKYKDKETGIRDYGDKWNREHAKYQILSQYKNEIGPRVAEVGCNSGYHCYLMAEFTNIKEFLGFDINRKALDLGDSKFRKEFPEEVSSKVKFIYSDICKIEGYSNYFDTIISFHVLEHIYPEDLKKVLLEKNKILKKDGNLIVSLPYKRSLYCSEHVNFFTLKSLNEAISSQGFIEKDLYIDLRTGSKCITGIYKKA